MDCLINFVMMIEPNIDAERFFTYVLPVFIVSFIVIIIFTILFIIPAHILTNNHYGLYGSQVLQIMLSVKGMFPP
jgi:uncharacterized membrane protein YadS